MRFFLLADVEVADDVHDVDVGLDLLEVFEEVVDPCGLGLSELFLLHHFEPAVLLREVFFSAFEVLFLLLPHEFADLLVQDLVRH